MGGILLVGIAIHVAKILTGTSSGVMGDLGNFWPNLVLIGLSAVPVVSLTIAGLAWVIRDRRDVTGWMAIVTALFLSSLWALK